MEPPLYYTQKGSFQSTESKEDEKIDDRRERNEKLPREQKGAMNMTQLRRYIRYILYLNTDAKRLAANIIAFFLCFCCVCRTRYPVGRMLVRRI